MLVIFSILIFRNQINLFAKLVVTFFDGSAAGDGGEGSCDQKSTKGIAMKKGSHRERGRGVDRTQSLFDSYLKNFTAKLDWLKGGEKGNTTVPRFWRHNRSIARKHFKPKMLISALSP